MAVKQEYLPDVEAILSHRQDQGGDFWTTPDKRLLKGSPFSAHSCALYLIELGMEPEDPVLQQVARLFFEAWREDGRFQVYGKGAIYPCHTVHALDVLCQLGYASDARVQTTFRHLLETRHTDGGWRCNKFSFGRGPETEYSNPYPTLIALNAFRRSEYLNQEPKLEEAVEFLLEHWVIRKPIGPCHYGIGSLFMQVEYPFHNYNLFQYVHVLSFYERAKKDARFLAALRALEDRMADGQIVVERVVPKLARLNFCKKGQPSELATERYREIIANLS